ncbi:MAG: hypothetical protein IKR08_07240, partial [Firmicutes bacterium]|nr:hypothetical protein [Bacillota bacterium]
LLPLLPLTVAAAMFERETFGLCFGIVAGALTDIGATAADGVNTLFFAAAGFICGLLVTYVFLNNVRSCLILGAVVMLLYAPFSWLAHVGFSAAGESVPLLFGFYLPIAVLGIAMLPPLYYLLRHIAKGFCTDGDDDYIFV